MVTYKDATQVFRYKCVNQQAKKVNSRAIFLLIAVKTNLCWGINSLDYQTINTNIVNQTNNINELNCTLSFCFSVSFTTDECASNYNWIYLQIVNLFWAYYCDFHEISFSNSGNVNIYTVQNGLKAFILLLICSLIYICQFPIEFNWTIQQSKVDLRTLLLIVQ